MKSTDHALAEEVRRTLKLGTARRIPWISLIAHLGSVATLAVAYFARSGRLDFNSTSLVEWAMAAAMVIAVVVGAVSLVAGSSAQPRELTREQLTTFINHARYAADNQVITVGGDLTWLPEDEVVLKDLVQNKGKDVRVYYQHRSVPEQLHALRKQLASIGVDFRPYPDGIDAPFRCLLTDGNDADGVRLYVYRRIGKKTTGMSRDSQRFEWLEYGGNDGLVRALKAFLWAAERRSVGTITVGITGANNVGKTSLARSLQTKLETKYAVSNYPDVFKDSDVFSGAKGKTALEPNYLMLVTQLWREATPSGDVAVFDRTAVDNFCYLHIKNAGTSSAARTDIIDTLVSAARKFDLIIYVKRRNEDWTTRTSYVSPRQRQRASLWLEKFYREHGLLTHTVELEEVDLQRAAAQAADVVIEKIEQIADQRKIPRRPKIS